VKRKKKHQLRRRNKLNTKIVLYYRLVKRILSKEPSKQNLSTDVNKMAVIKRSRL